jgi:S-DNA-T family DNA segregation ATPase FtsK/SpoIIIE
MPVIPPSLLSPQAAKVVMLGMRRLWGMVLFLSGLVLALALATHDFQDASLNTAVSDGAVKNLLGPQGAVLSDILFQSFGMAAFVLPLLILAWGVHFWQSGKAFRVFVRLGQWVMVLVLGATVMSLGGDMKQDAIDVPRGGVAGFWLQNLFHLYGPQGPVWDWIAAGGLVVLFGTFLVLGLGLSGSGFTNGGPKALLSWVWNLPIMAWQGGKGLLARLSLSGSADLQPLSITTESLMPAVEKNTSLKTKKTKAVPTLHRSPLLYDTKQGFQLPPMDLLTLSKTKAQKMDQREIQRASEALSQVLSDFGVKGDIVGANSGPVVTLYELEPAPGIKSSRIIGLADDIARSMSAVSARVAVVTGRNVIGIELPNPKRETVYLREVFEHKDYQSHAAKLPLALGKDINGVPVIVDLAKMPHLLVAGTTGSGKSVSVNTMILSLLYMLPPEKCRFIMVDPKMLELSVYDDIPHLLTPVVTDPKKAVTAMKWAVKEMEQRYQAMSRLGVRNIEGYNSRIQDAQDKGEILHRRVQTGFDRETGKPVFEDQVMPLETLPYIVVIVDEMADLMLVAGKDIEAAIQRLAQMARAAGIHLIMATQRPSVDVITGTIKANFPVRISFQVTSKIDSRTILGEMGAEQLLGQGDMLYMAGGGRITRVHGPFVADNEVESIVSYLKAQGQPDYVDDVTVAEDDDDDDGGAFKGESGDALYDQALAIILRERKVSTSFLQRHLQVGYNRAARIIEKLEEEGVISQPNHAGKREILGA